jgi:hypothetical protein
MSLIVAFAVSRADYFAGAGAATVEADDALIGTHGCTGAFCPGSTGGPAARIIPAGHGANNSVGLTSAGSGGACIGPFDATLSFEPGQAYGAFVDVP